MMLANAPANAGKTANRLPTSELANFFEHTCKYGVSSPSGQMFETTPRSNPAQTEHIPADQAITVKIPAKSL